jgi:hypothetical protein
VKKRAAGERTEEEAPPPLEGEKNVPTPPKSRSYEDYREAGWREDDSSIWEVKVNGKWVEATVLESRLFDKRLKERGKK